MFAQDDTDPDIIDIDVLVQNICESLRALSHRERVDDIV